MEQHGTSNELIMSEYPSVRYGMDVIQDENTLFKNPF